jgi:hypothetical protein
MGRTQKAHLTAFQYLDLGLSNLSEVGPCRPCLILFGRQNILLFANFGIQVYGWSKAKPVKDAGMIAECSVPPSAPMAGDKIACPTPVQARVAGWGIPDTEKSCGSAGSAA